MSSSRDSVRGLRSGLVNVDGDEAGCSNGVTCLEAGCEGGCEVRAQVVSSRRPSDATTDSTRRIVPSPAGLHASSACTLEESKLSARFLTRSANYHARNLHPSRAIRNHKQLPQVKKDFLRSQCSACVRCCWRVPAHSACTQVPLGPWRCAALRTLPRDVLHFLRR